MLAAGLKKGMLKLLFAGEIVAMQRNGENINVEAYWYSWLVFISVENFEHDRCVDLFSRPDGSYGFEEFRRDVEDRGDWTPVRYYAGSVYTSKEATLAAAMQSVAWLADAIQTKPFCTKIAAANFKLKHYQKTRCSFKGR